MAGKSARTMRAYVVRQPGGPDVLELDSEQPFPACPSFDGVILRIRAFGLNRSELLTREGHSGPLVSFPRVLGIEAVGVVEEVSPDLQRHEGRQSEGRYAKGDIVLAALGGMGRGFDGSYAEYAAVPAICLSPPLELPDLPLRADDPSSLSWSLLAAIPVTYTTAFGILDVGLRLEQGQSLLVHGASSSVGIALAQLAKTPRFAASHIVGTTRDVNKREALLKAGYDAIAIVPARNGQNDDPSKAVKAVRAQNSRPEGFDCSVELIGTTNLAVSLQCAKRPGGRVCSAGGLAHGWTLQDWSLANIPTGVFLGRYTSDQYDSNLLSIPELVEMTASGRLTPIVDRVFSFDELQEAHRYMDDSMACGKVVCVIGDSSS